MTSAAASGLNPARLAKIDRFLKERYLEPGRLPGAFTIVHRRGETAHWSPLGHA
ncbi:MAG: serine hydrolase, partial [Alphaproteobacteria bacterium]|nr:serine hydrolase [Alphaproteobacteria bacterium]